jgi:putative effector of murein hydrolase
MRYCVLVTNGYGKPVCRSTTTEDHNHAIASARAYNKANQDSTHSALSAHVEGVLYCSSVPVDKTLLQVR